MKKILLSTLALALLSVVAVLPYLFGVQAERIFQQQMDLLDSNNKISIVESHFQRGWFSSVARTVIAIRDRKFTILAVHTIEHGPIPVSEPIQHILSLTPLQALIHSDLSIPGIAQSGGNLAMGALTTSVNIDSTTSTRIDIPPADTQTADAATLAWEAIAGRIVFEPARSSWKGIIHIGGVDWGQEESSFTIGRSTLEFLTYPGSTGLAMGNSTFSTESIQVHMPAVGGPVESTGLVIESTATEEGQNVGYTINGSLTSVMLPAIEVTGGNWSMAARDLDLDTLTDLNGIAIDAALPLNKLIALVSRRNAKLETALQLETDSGPVEVTTNVQLSGKGGSVNPLMLIGALRGDISLEMPGPVVALAAQSALKNEWSNQKGVGQDPEVSGNQDSESLNAAVSHKIQSWVDRNMLTRRGNQYLFRASINDGSVRLNGKPFDFLSLLR